MSDFKIMRDTYKCSVHSVPMEYATKFEISAQKNHGQSIYNLNERGGLSPREFYLVAHNMPLKELRNISEEMAVKWLEETFGLLGKIQKLQAENERLRKALITIEEASPIGDIYCGDNSFFSNGWYSVPDFIDGVFKNQI